MPKKRRPEKTSKAKESKKEKILSQRNLVITIIVGVTVIVSFLIELPKKISETIHVLTSPTSVTTPKAFPTADNQTSLIVVANFQNRGGDQNTLDPSQYIYEHLKTQIQKDHLPIDVRRLYEDVNENTVFDTGHVYNASIVLWGWYDVFTINPRLELINKQKIIVPNELRWHLTDPEKIEYIIVTDLPNQATYLSLLTLGVERYWSGKYDVAFQYLDKAIRNLPSDSLISTNPSELYFYRGSIYLNQKLDFENALNDFNIAIQLKPDFWAAYNARGITYTFTKKYKEALSDFDFVIQLNPNIAVPYNNRGLIYDYQGDYDRAILDYEKALQINPNYQDAYYNLGFAYLNKGEFDQAIANFNRSAQLDPNHASTYAYRGTAFVGKENYDLALNDYNKAIELRPDYAEAYYGRGLLYYNVLGNYDLAQKDFEKVLEVSNDVSLRRDVEALLQTINP